MIWALDYDCFQQDFPDGPYPLLTTLKDVLMGNKEYTDVKNVTWRMTFAPPSIFSHFLIHNYIFCLNSYCLGNSIFLLYVLPSIRVSLTQGRNYGGNGGEPPQTSKRVGKLTILKNFFFFLLAYLLKKFSWHFQNSQWKSQRWLVFFLFFLFWRANSITFWLKGNSSPNPCYLRHRHW